MDVAGMITEAASSLYKKECQERKYIITISMHGGRYKNDINLVPMANHIILIFKLLNLKLHRQELNAFNDAVTFLVNEVEDAIINNLNDDIEYNDYWPENDEFYNEHYVFVNRENETIFCKKFKQEDMQKVVCGYIKNLRFATIIT
jgi:hypothetical protein